MQMKITKGLIIADPWIGFILDGSKTWEMRSTATSHRGWFGLIRKGTGAIYGVARVAAVGAPLSEREMLAAIGKHRIPESMIRSGQVAKWNTPWILEDVRPLHRPVPYQHKSGAVTWVDLDESVSSTIADEMRGGLPRHVAPKNVAAPAATRNTEVAKSVKRQPASGPLLGEVTLTAGNITHSHIYLRSFFDRFPEECVGGSNRDSAAKRLLTVDWGGATPVQTDLDGSKKFFRSRGWIRSFFEENSAREGDRVRVEQTGPYAYRVSLRR